LRAAFHGRQGTSAYQNHAIASLVYTIFVLGLLPDDSLQGANLTDGLRVFTEGWSLILLQMLWIVPQVGIESRLRFHVY